MVSFRLRSRLSDHYRAVLSCIGRFADRSNLLQWRGLGDRFEAIASGGASSIDLKRLTALAHKDSGLNPTFPNGHHLPRHPRHLLQVISAPVVTSKSQRLHVFPATPTSQSNPLL